MPGVRQQRGNPARGGVPFVRLATAPPMTWAVAGRGASSLLVRIYEPTGDVFVVGVPAFVVDGTAVHAISVVQSLLDFTVTFSATVPAAALIVLPATDPAIRSSTGAFLAPGRAQLVAPPQVNADFFTANGEANLDICVWNDPLVDGTLSLPALPAVGEQRWFLNPSGNASTLHVVFADMSPLSDLAPGSKLSVVWNGTAWV